jgi:hypothetical protein
VRAVRRPVPEGRRHERLRAGAGPRLRRDTRDRRGRGEFRAAANIRCACSRRRASRARPRARSSARSSAAIGTLVERAAGRRPLRVAASRTGRGVRYGVVNLGGTARRRSRETR